MTVFIFWRKKNIETFKLFAQSPYRNNMRHIDERGYNHYRARTTRITVAFSIVCPNNHAITRKRITYITVIYIYVVLTNPIDQRCRLCAVGEGFEFEAYTYIIIAERTFAVYYYIILYIL